MAVTQPLAEMLEHLRIDGRESFAWLGQRFDAAAASEAPGPLDRLGSALEERLYADFFCTGGIAPPARPEDRDRGLRGPAADEFSAANAGAGSPQPGWVVEAFVDGTVVVVRDGLRLWIDPAKVIGPAPRPGAVVSVRLPKELLGLPGGFYTAYGDVGDAGDAGPLDRFYWNVRADGRAFLVALLTERLNRAGIAFRLKVLNDPHDVRCDGGVLYVPSERRSAIRGLLSGALRQVEARLRPGVPAFTLRLAPGLSFAEDPPGATSFGEHRCRLVAEALVGAHGRGIGTIRGRHEAIAARWARDGLTLEVPYLNPGSHPRRSPAPLR